MDTNVVKTPAAGPPTKLAILESCFPGKADMDANVVKTPGVALLENL